MMNEFQDDIKIYSEEVRDILSDPPKSIFRWGNVILLCFLMLLFVLSWFIKYPDVIEAEAVVTTQIPPQKEYAKTTGKIAHLLVQNNDIVYEGTPIAVLENSANYKDVFFLKAILDTIYTDSKSFVFPMDSLPVLFLGDLEPYFALFQNNYIQYQLNRDLQPFLNEERANHNTEVELQTRLSLLENQKESNKTELLFKEKELQRYSQLFKKDVISSQEYESKQMEYFQAERNYKNMGVSISQLKEQISDARRNSRGTHINRSSEELMLLKAVVQSCNELKRALRDWELQYTFISNIQGKVSFLSVWNKNQTIKPEDLLFTIIPIQDTSFVSRLKTPSQNSGKIKVGQRVNIRLENYPETEYGMLVGKVKNIALLPDENGDYTIDVKLQRELITTYGKEIKFIQEMRGKADIITEDLRLIERLLYQFKSIMDRN